jgi:hypothetical protein
MADEPRDPINEAIMRAAEITFLAVEHTKKLMPNPIGQPASPPQTSLKDIQRLLER